MPDDFIEACDRIITLDEWFPTVARIRTVAAECRTERSRSTEAIAAGLPVSELVCPYCHGARWVVTMRGYDPINMLAGESNSRAQPCPGCTAGGTYYADKEYNLIVDEGGVRNPNTQQHIDPSMVSTDVVRNPDGTLNMTALYRQSRVMRNLDPDGDDRPSVNGFKTFAEVAR